MLSLPQEKLKMHLHRVLAIGRAERFSPNSVDKDAAILNCVCGELIRKGYDVETVSETVFKVDTEAVASISMGRSEDLLCKLRGMEQRGCLVVNSTIGVSLCCHRRRLTEMFASGGIPVAPEEGASGYWLKRADGVAEGPGDVRFAADGKQLLGLMEDMKRSGMDDILVSAHVPGDLVKFYGVSGSRFFRVFYPGDDGLWKFGDEARNGRPEHYPFSITALQACAERAAKVACTDIYGGDCIVRADGSFVIIDFNDWPSFSRCREEAAVAIAGMVAERIGNFKKP